LLLENKIIYNMKLRKVNKNVSTGTMPPPVGFKVAPVQPQIVPASTSGTSNVAAMRANFAFLPYNADEMNKRIYAAKVAWKSKNPNLGEDDFVGMTDPYGSGQIIAKGANVVAAEAEAERVAKIQASCRPDQVFRSDINRCECDRGMVDKNGKCVPDGKEKCVGTFC
jgi:hypothetical protein